MQKLKPLLPTLREDRRYLVYEVISAKPIKSSFNKAFLGFFKEKLGVFDAAGAGLLPVSFEAKLQRGMISVNRKYVDKIKAIITLYNQPETMIRVLGVSGMIKKAKHRYMKNPN
jgi:RNase P/RNase MRP subunit POP5